MDFPNISFWKDNSSIDNSINNQVNRDTLVTLLNSYRNCTNFKFDIQESLNNFFIFSGIHVYYDYDPSLEGGHIFTSFDECMTPLSGCQLEKFEFHLSYWRESFGHKLSNYKALYFSHLDLSSLFNKRLKRFYLNLKKVYYEDKCLMFTFSSDTFIFYLSFDGYITDCKWKKDNGDDKNSFLYMRDVDSSYSIYKDSKSMEGSQVSSNYSQIQRSDKSRDIFAQLVVKRVEEINKFLGSRVVNEKEEIESLKKEGVAIFNSLLNYLDTLRDSDDYLILSSSERFNFPFLCCGTLDYNVTYISDFVLNVEDVKMAMVKDFCNYKNLCYNVVSMVCPSEIATSMLDSSEIDSFISSNDTEGLRLLLENYVYHFLLSSRSKGSCYYLLVSEDVFNILKNCLDNYSMSIKGIDVLVVDMGFDFKMVKKVKIFN